MELPDFVGWEASLEPPFQFKNVATCVFPLRAQLNTLQRFVDSYLNIIPEELGHFRASVPYAYLMLLDYGKLAAQVTNLGWFAQREVGFFVPVEWYKRIDGELVFHNWASVAPFIYVDAEMSMTLGRTALGWPKSLVNLRPSATGWLQDPTSPSTDAVVSAQVFPKSFSGDKMEERIFMEVRSPSYSSFGVPPNPDGLLAPWTMWANAASTMTGLAADWLAMLGGMGLMPPHEGSSFDNLSRKGAKALEMASGAVPWAPGMTFNCLNLKQFRRADRPDEYCYQALLNGPMRTTAFNRGARLGQVLGDPSGGYTIDLVGWPNFPIVDTLGLHAEYIPSIEGPDVARLKPVFPFWYDVNMEYARTSTIAWRTGAAQWHDAEGEGYPQASSSRPEPTKPLYNTTTGAASPVITGPFKFPKAKLDVLPLLSRRASLEKLIDDNLNKALQPGCLESFKLWAGSGDHAYVYLVTTDWGDVISETNSIGDWAGMSSTFYIPVKRYLDERLVGGGLMPWLAFASGTTEACTLAELYGVPTVTAEFIRPPPEGRGVHAQASSSLLKIDAESLLSLGQGQTTERSTLVELVGAAYSEDQELSGTSRAFCQLLKGEVFRKDFEEGQGEGKEVGRAVALLPLVGEAPLHVYTIKQFRDATKPAKACYQALVQIPYTFEEIHQIEEVERPICAKIYQRASYPIVETLGLIAREVAIGDAPSVHVVEAVRPFSILAGVCLGNGTRLQFRVGEQWEKGCHPGQEQHEELVPPDLPALRKLERKISEESRCCYIKRQFGIWHAERWKWDTDQEEDKSVEGDRPWLQVDPQRVLESILSREWENRSSDSIHRQARDQLERRIRRHGVGTCSDMGANLRWLASERGAQLGPDGDYYVRSYRPFEHLLLLLDEAEALEGDGPSSREHEVFVQRAWELWCAGGLYQTLLGALRDKHQPSRAHKEVSRDGFDRSVRAVCAKDVRHALRLARETAKKVLEEEIGKVISSEHYRKPDHCVPRSIAGRERDRVFPRQYCWNEQEWYKGGEPIN